MRLKVGVLLSLLCSVFLLDVAILHATGERGDSKLQTLQKKGQERKGNRYVRDKEFNAIMDLTAGVAPEFAADILIRLSESGKLNDRQTKVRLLEQAFDIASNAEQPIKRTSAVFLPDTRSGYLALAFRFQNLDTLSLQSRVVIDMLALDPVKARELLEQIKLNLAPVPCEQPLTYDVTLFYQAIASTSKQGFTPKEGLEGRRNDLLVSYLSSLQSHAQVRPASEMLLNADLSSADLGQAATLFAEGLSQLKGDERSFAATNMPQQGDATAGGSVSHLISVLDSKQIPSTSLLKALREYLVSNVGGHHCASTTGAADNFPKLVQDFNRRFRLSLTNAGIRPISTDELRNARIDETFVDVAFWQSPESKRLFVGMR